MVETLAIAISPDKTHLVVVRNNRHYAVIERKIGINKDTRWRDKKILSSMMVKGEYKKFKEPVKYLGLNNKKEE